MALTDDSYVPNFPRLLRAQFRGLSSHIYFAFLMAAVIPTAIAGFIGVYQSQQALRQETLCNLNQEVSIRAKAVGHFFDQFSADLLTLAASRTLKELNIARAHGNQAEIEAAVKRLETRYIWVTPPERSIADTQTKAPPSESV